jgi:hypothetical protein
MRETPTHTLFISEVRAVTHVNRDILAATPRSTTGTSTAIQPRGKQRERTFQYSGLFLRHRSAAAISDVAINT